MRPTTNHDRPGAARPAARAVRRGAIALVVAGASVLVGCSLGDDGGVAEVTLPELDTTTTTAPEPGAGGGSGSASGAQGDDALPEPSWTVQFGGSGDDEARALTALDTRIVVVGATTAELPSLEEGRPARAGLGGTDVLVAHVDTEGTLVALDGAGTAADDLANGVAANGAGMMACGSTAGQLGAGLGGAVDLWCALVDDEQTLAAPVQLGGTDSESVTDLAGDPEQDRLYAAGRVGGLLPGAQDPTGRGLGAGDAVALQLTPDGTPVWARQFGTPNEDGATGAAITPDGDGIVVGYTDGDLGRTSSGGRDAWISRFDPSGRQRWITQIGSPGTDVIESVAIAGEPARGTEAFIAAGTTDGDIAGVGRTGGSGSGGEGDADGDAPGTAPGGPGEPPDAPAVTDGFAASFGTDGSLTWITPLASDGSDSTAAIVVDGAVAYVAGTTSGDLGELVPAAGPGGGSDGFLAALDIASGEVLWVARFGSADDEQITSMTTTEDGLVVLAGTTTGQMAETPPAGGVDAFLIAFPLAAAGGGAASIV